MISLIRFCFFPRTLRHTFFLFVIFFTLLLASSFIWQAIDLLGNSQNLAPLQIDENGAFGKGLSGYFMLMGLNYLLIWLLSLIGFKVVAARIRQYLNERELSQTALLHANTIINRSQIIAFLWKNEENWPVEFVTENVETLFGYSAQEFQNGKISYSATIHREDVQRVKEGVVRFSKQPDLVAFDHEPYRIVNKTGQVRWVAGTTYLRRNAKGDITHYEGIVQDCTRWLELKNKLKESEEKFAKSFYHHPTPIEIFNMTTGERVEVSKSFIDLFGDAQEEGQGGTIYSNTIWLDSASQQKAIDRLRREKVIINAPFALKNKDGGIIQVLGSGSVLDLGDGDLALASFIDISLLKKAEQELSIRDKISSVFIVHQENNLYGEVLNIVQGAMASSLGVFGYLDASGNLICPSMSTSKVWKKCCMKNKTRIFPADTWAGIWKKALTTGITQCGNTPFTVPERHLTINNSMVAPILFQDEVLGLLQVANKETAYTQDDQQRLERMAATVAPILAATLARERAENRYRSVVQDLPLLICRSTSDGEILFVNNTYASYFGVEPDAMVGQYFWEFIPPGEQLKIREALALLSKEQPFVSHDHRVIRADGEERVMRWTNRLVIEEGKQVILAYGEDVTDHLLLEARLLQGEKMATIAGLAAGVAHEINTPLSGILQAMQMVELGLDPNQEANRVLAGSCGVDLEKLDDYLQQKELDFFLAGIKESALNAAHIVSDLLQFSRPQKLSPVSVVPAEMIDRAVELARADYALKKEYGILLVEFSREYSQEMQELTCVPMEIEQVLINLIKNSCQAMAGEGGPEDPRIILRLFKQEKMVVIEVEDNGPGLVQNVIRHAFDPFFTTKDVGKGTGLGLYVAYSIICDKHGGTIHVTSPPGNGARFTIELPIQGEGA